MAKLKVSLSIGYSGCCHNDIIDIDDEELAECENEQQREDLINDYWQSWANNYIDGSSELMD